MAIWLTLKAQGEEEKLVILNLRSGTQEGVIIAEVKRRGGGVGGGGAGGQEGELGGGVGEEGGVPEKVWCRVSGEECRSPAALH